MALAESKRKGSGMILFLVFVIAAVGVSNTMLMAVFERMRELGTMRALGMGDRQTALVAWMVNVGLDYTSISRQMDFGYRISGVFRGAWDPQAMVRAFVLGILIAVAVAFVPTRRALKMRITDCLRND